MELAAATAVESPDGQVTTSSSFDLDSSVSDATYSANLHVHHLQNQISQKNLLNESHLSPSNHPIHPEMVSFFSHMVPSQC